MSWRRATGDDYESRALTRLQREGLKLVERNFNTRFGELDLIMRDADTLVFVEVRYRRNQNFGGAVLSVTPNKQARLIRAAGLYLKQHPALAQQPCRFDVVAFGNEGGQPRCQWLPNAFEAF